MYKIIVVEDEAILRRGMAASLQKGAPELLRVVGTASNGQEGLELILSIQPDIILSDVKMPKMDGLEMVRRAREEGVTARVLFMSGYEEFELVRSALTLKADHYLLKPIRTADLLETLQKLCRELDQERYLRAQMEENLPVMRQSFLQNLLTRPVQREKVLQGLNCYGLPLRDGRFTVLLCRLDGWDKPGKVADRELYKYGVCNITTELLERHFCVAVCYDGEDSFTAILQGKDPLALSMEEVLTVCSDICRQVERHLGVTLTIGAGRCRPGFGGIAVSYREACTAVDFRHILGNNRVISVEEVSLLGRTETIDLGLDQLESQLASQVKLGLAADARATLEEIRALLKNAGLSLPRARMIGTELLVLILREVGNWHGGEQLQARLRTVGDEIGSRETLDGILDVLLAVTEELIETIRESCDTQQKIIVEQAMRYIGEHFADEHLSLQEVAGAVHVSAPYLSTMFKRERGESFVSYLTDLRLQKAQELLRSTPLKVYEVAQKTGFSNQQYFSQCFKKHTGYSPLQFKNV